MGHCSIPQTVAARAFAKATPGPKDGDNSLNRLYEVVRAQQPHEGCPMSPQQVELICNVIENIQLEDLGLNPALGQAMTYGSAGSARELRARLRHKGSRGTVTYLDIHDDPAMTIGIFQLPPGARMPLHDHPGMTVFSRLLYGTLHVRAYDWVSPPDTSMDSHNGSPDSSPTRSNSSTGSHNSSITAELALGGGGSSSVQPARLVTDRVLTAPADTMVLFPASGGNIHAFTAISPCAILDVLTPPYGNRNCTYYREVFPPQWMDQTGQPNLVPSEDVASWVAWQAAGQQQQQPGSPAAAAAALQQQQGQQPLQQQHQAPSTDSDSSCGGGGGQQQQQQVMHYPDALGQGDGGREDIIVGLEVWKEPADFHVARGTYSGLRVTPRQM